MTPGASHTSRIGVYSRYDMNKEVRYVTINRGIY